MKNEQKEYRIVAHKNGRTEVIETIVSDRDSALEKMIGIFIDREVDRQFEWAEGLRKLYDESGDLYYSFPSTKIGTSDNYVTIVPTGYFEIEANVPIEVIVDKEDDSGSFPIRIEKTDVIINPIDYGFRNRVDPRRSLSSEDVKEILGNLETLTFWGSTILARLNKVEAEIFTDVLRDIAEILEKVDKKTR